MPPPLPHHVTLKEQALLMDLTPTLTLRLIKQCHMPTVKRSGQTELHERHALALLRCHLKYDWDMTLKTLKLPARDFPLPVKPFHYAKYSKLLARTWRQRHAKTLIIFTKSFKKPRKKKTS